MKQRCLNFFLFIHFQLLHLNFSLWLTKRHDIKTYNLLTTPRRRAGGSGSIVPRIHNLGTIWNSRYIENLSCATFGIRVIHLRYNEVRFLLRPVIFCLHFYLAQFVVSLVQRIPVGAGSFSLGHGVQTDSRANPPSYPMGIGRSFPGYKEAGG